MTTAESRRRKALVARARRLLPDLPTASLYQVAGLLERALAEGSIDDAVYADLERALRRGRRPAKR